MNMRAFVKQHHLGLPILVCLACVHQPAAAATVSCGAAPVCVLVTPLNPPVTDITEGQTLQVSFRVTNNDTLPLLLDLAMATITTTGDTTSDPNGDWLHFTGVNGSTGVGNFCLSIPVGGNCVFTYNTATDAPDIGPFRDATNVFSFEIEMSPVPVGGANVANAGGQGNALVQNGGAGINAPLAASLLAPLPTGLYLGTPPLPCPNPTTNAGCMLLYPASGIPGVEANGTTSPSVRTIFVSDTPEPASMLLSATSLVVLIGLLWKHRVSGPPSRAS